MIMAPECRQYLRLFHEMSLKSLLINHAFDNREMKTKGNHNYNCLKEFLIPCFE